MPHPACFNPWKVMVPIVQEAGWAPGTLWTCAEDLAPTRIRSPDRPTCPYTDYAIPCHTYCAVYGITLLTLILLTWRICQQMADKIYLGT